MVANVDIKRYLIQIIRCDRLGEVISDGSARHLPLNQSVVSISLDVAIHYTNQMFPSVSKYLIW